MKVLLFNPESVFKFLIYKDSNIFIDGDFKESIYSSFEGMLINNPYRKIILKYVD